MTESTQPDLHITIYGTINGEDRHSIVMDVRECVRREVALGGTALSEAELEEVSLQRYRDLVALQTPPKPPQKGCFTRAVDFLVEELQG